MLNSENCSTLICLWKMGMFNSKNCGTPVCLWKISMLNYRPQTKLRKGIVFTPVCQSFCSQVGVCLSTCWIHPLGRHPHWADTPPRADTPIGQTSLLSSACWDTRTVRILLECILVLRTVVLSYVWKMRTLGL